ncbi:GNS1/SUR4 family-domain-containing protein [Bisporella sp. PMI_857]|nr:GNS1/SUR4 family-domain-containing protein [Bisporella sp. PMI_857]
MDFENVQFSAPSSSLFTLRPSSDPLTLPPPQAGSTLSAPPFSIPASVFNAALDPKVPITIASLYAVTVTLVNRSNKKAGNKPWAISKYKSFFWFVVAHNVLLAVYSAWTFVGMWGALRRSLYNPTGPAGITGTVDSLCKIQGVRGFGNAVTYDPAVSQWIAQSPGLVTLSADGTPNSTDLGRLWNEGLAFYGWFFYLSKFYEVLDTFIILAKGKRSSTLQTYHHAGAMMCMWAGIRFMSPPIWMFAFVNSAIHTLMYTYYTLTAFSVPIPKALKQSLTTMQIVQFLVGSAYASIHSFISYNVPVQISNASFAGASSAASSVVTSAAAVATSAGVGDFVKKMILRAAGEPALAENINSERPAPSAKPQPIGSTVNYHTEYQTVPCLDTSGQTFAIWLNVFYLTPLTFLFMRFFVKSYIRRTSKKGADFQAAAEGAGVDALKGLGRELYPRSRENRERSENEHPNGVANGTPNGAPNGKAKANGKAKH